MLIYQHPKKTRAELQKLGGFSRAGTYRMFEKLREERLLTSSPENWRKNVEAVSLRTIAEKLGRESLKLRKIEYELKSIEKLFQLQPQSAEPVEIFTDQNQITEQCYRLIHADWDHISSFGSGEKAYDVPGQKAMEDFVSMRARKGRTIDSIFTELGQRTGELLKRNSQELRNGKLKVDPLNQYYMAHIYDRQVTIWQEDQVLGKRVTLVKDPGMIRLYQSQFQKLWSEA